MEKVLGLAVVSSMLCVGSVFGKYVRGIVNTKEVSIMFTFCYYWADNGSEFSFLLQLRISWLLLVMGCYSSCYASVFCARLEAWCFNSLCVAKIITPAAIEQIKLNSSLRHEKNISYKRRSYCRQQMYTLPSAFTGVCLSLHHC